MVASFALLSLLGVADAASFCDQDGWNMIWSDEFEGTGDVNPDVWYKDVRGPGDSRTRDAEAIAEAVSVKDGAMVIETKATWDGSAWTNLTSGAIWSQNRKSFKGRSRVCVRAKLPGGGGNGAGDGIWPAHWLLPDDGSCWPSGGEIDIMEMVKGDGHVHGTYHWPCGAGSCKQKHPDSSAVAPTVLSDFDTEWHEYAVEFSTSSVSFALDGEVYHTVTPETTTTKCGNWSGSHAQLFDKPYYIILNSAVGGSNWPGRATARTKFPTYHYVDFVRVAQPAQSSPWCLDGIHSENACCPASCGVCGGRNCQKRPGGDDCCGGVLLAGRNCTDAHDTACRCPQPNCGYSSLAV